MPGRTSPVLPSQDSSKISQQIAARTFAEHLGLEVDENVDLKLSDIEAAVSESATKEEGFHEMRRCASGVKSLLEELAERSNNRHIQDFLDQYNTEIDSRIEDLIDDGIKTLGRSSKHGEDVARMCMSLNDIIEHGYKLTGLDDKKEGEEEREKTEKEIEEEKRKENMKKLVMFVISIIGALLLTQFGVSIEVISLGAVVVKAYSDSKKDQALDKSIDALSKLATSREGRGAIDYGLKKFKPRMHQGFKLLGVEDKSDELINEITKSKEHEELFQASKNVRARLFDNTKSGREFIVSGRDKIIERFAKNPETRQKDEQLQNIMTRELDNLLSATEVSEALDKITKREGLDKTIDQNSKDFVDMHNLLSSKIDRFDRNLQGNSSLTRVQKVQVKKFAHEMKEFLKILFVLPTRRLAKAAEKVKKPRFLDLLKVNTQAIKRVVSRGRSAETGREIS